MAHKKGKGSSKNGRDSHSKRLGVKCFDGQKVKAGQIIIRQRGSKFHTGENARFGKDFTIFSTVDGTVSFSFVNKNKKAVSIIPLV